MGSTKYKLLANKSFLTIDFVSLKVEDATGKDLGISPQGFTLLSTFVRSPEKMHTHNELRNLLWGENSTAGNINNAISSLRRFLQKALEAGEEYFVNKPGIGYTLEVV